MKRRCLKLSAGTWMPEEVAQAGLDSMSSGKADTQYTGEAGLGSFFCRITRNSEPRQFGQAQ